MADSTKENIKMGLLVLTAATVVYGTFIKEDKASPSSRRVAPRAAQQPAQPQQPANPATPNFQTTPEKAQQNLQKPAVPVGPTTQMAFKGMIHDFGTINQDTKNETVFNFTNTGKEPLIIESAQGSCGCTVPEYPKEPIAPGATGQIKVQYSPGKQKGQQTKTVTLMANTEPRETRLTITAQVEEVQ